MAKSMKKKPIVKAASKPAKKPATKAAAKPAKKAGAKPAPKAAAKIPAKNAAKNLAKPAPLKKKFEKAPPAKAAPKAAAAKPAKKATGKTPPVKAAAPKKGAPAAPQKKVEKPVKEEVLKGAKKATPAPVAPKPSKKEGKASGKKGKPAKKDDEELEDDFIADDDLGHDEIGEYEEELKAVETLDEETDDVADWSLDQKEKVDEEIYLTDAEGRRYCRARDCDQAAIVDAYCRYHYLLFWKKIQVRKRILLDGKLERYIEELTARYPDKFLEMIRRDLRTEKDFLSAIQELEIDESNLDSDNEEDTQSFIEEVRGMGEGSSTGVEDEEF